jgi:hypothetical protein
MNWSEIKMNPANFLSICAIVLLFGYIVYNESSGISSTEVISDDGVYEAGYAGEDQRLPAVYFAVTNEKTF